MVLAVMSVGIGFMGKHTEASDRPQMMYQKFWLHLMLN